MNKTDLIQALKEVKESPGAFYRNLGVESADRKKTWCQRKSESCDLVVKVKEAGRDEQRQSNKDKLKNSDLF